MWFLDQDRLRLIGLSPTEVAQQLQFLLTGVTVTQVREDIRTVDVVARSWGSDRLDPARLRDFTLTSRDGCMHLTMVETDFYRSRIVSFVRCAGPRLLSPQRELFKLIRSKRLPGWSFCALQRWPFDPGLTVHYSLSVLAI
jgi:hypothetical protein